MTVPDDAGSVLARFTAALRLAYADPPYLGCCGLYGHYHPDGRCWDDLTTHRLLMDRLVSEYPDGWALSMASTNMQTLLPLLPYKVRIAAWAKSFASFKPNVNPAYTWEPVVFHGGRRGDRSRLTVQDHIVAPITLQRGLTGAKPESVCRWILDLLGFEHGDTLDDLFPGTGVMGHVAALVANELPIREATG